MLNSYIQLLHYHHATHLYHFPHPHLNVLFAHRCCVILAVPAVVVFQVYLLKRKGSVETRHLRIQHI